jgi:glycosyltransferase involved in cell wall biosynthesis
MVTAKREHVIRQSLTSLLACRGMTADDVIVVQDGNDEATAQVVRAFGVALHQKPVAALRLDGAARIAQQYGYALRYALEVAAPSAPGLIVAEDDFLFSPDFYEYFHAVAPALEADRSLWLASAWNDNGNRHMDRDPSQLHRTRYFPGLGWLLPRAVWEQELRGSWPAQHWDHWMRAPERHKNRDIIFPQVSRDYHIGVKGTFMDQTTHVRYFRDVGMQADAQFSWFSPTGAASVRNILNPHWETHFKVMLSSAAVLNSVQEVLAHKQGVGLLVHASREFMDNHDFRMIAPLFGIWHEPERGSRAGVHVIPWRESSTILLVHQTSPLLREAMEGKRAPPVIPAGAFEGAIRPGDVSPPEGSLGGVSAPWVEDQLPTDPGADCGKRPLRVVSPLDDEPTTRDFAAGSIDLVPVTGEPNSKGALSASLPWIVPRSAPRRAGVYEYRPVGSQGPAAGTVQSPKAGRLALAHPELQAELPEHIVAVAASSPGRNCDQVCSEEGKGRRCHAQALVSVNSCKWLSAFFGCSSSCVDSMGGDQPAFVDSQAPGDKHPGRCLLNTDPSLFSCSGRWQFSHRLCTCV